MTLAEWADLHEDVEGELLDGVLVEEEMPTHLHEVVVVWLAAQLLRWATPRGGWVFGSERKIAVAPRRGRKPDLSVDLSHAPDPHATLTTTPPEIVVEVISPRPRDTRRDRIEKADEYARFGVAWYWLVDPAVRTLEIWKLGPRRRYERALSKGDGRARIPGCRGLVLDLDELWGLCAALEAGRRPKRRR
jgi:Uma2 family endonuclease